MRAAVVGAARRVTLAQVEVPQPGPEQVLVALEGCGVCGSNLPVWEGRPWFVYPREPGNPGHEGWGRIVARGAEVDDWAIGDRVAFLSDHAFAEYDVADASVLVALPAGLDGLDVPGEALGCAMNVFRRCEITPGQTVAVVGVGFIGALVLALAGKAGATVIGLSTRETALAFARELGAAAAVSLAQRDDQVVEAVTRIVGGQGCDCVIEATGLQRPLDIAARLCGTRRRLVIAGFHQDGPRSVDMQLWNWRGLDVINAHERECSAYVHGMRAAVDAMSTGQLDLRPFITHRVPLADSQAAFELLHTRPHGFVKAVIVP
jgi:threonine dehydrogenase-like Zn-dependent dehydrogenase